MYVFHRRATPKPVNSVHINTYNIWEALEGKSMNWRVGDYSIWKWYIFIYADRDREIKKERWKYGQGAVPHIECTCVNVCVCLYSYVSVFEYTQVFIHITYKWIRSKEKNAAVILTLFELFTMSLFHMYTETSATATIIPTNLYYWML